MTRQGFLIPALRDRRAILARGCGAALVAGAQYYAAVFAIGFALGIVRTLLITPRIGALLAVLIELPVMLTASWLIAGRLVRGRDFTAIERAAMGATGFILLMLSEALLATLLPGRQPPGARFGQWARSLTDAPGLIGLGGQLMFAAIPMQAGKTTSAAKPVDEQSAIARGA